MTNPFITYYPNGNKEFEQYWVNKKLHRHSSEGPALIWYYENGNIKIEQYRLNNKLHRDPLEGPAEIWYYKNGHKKFEKYWFNSLLHNPYGPAFNDYFLHTFEWYFNDKEYTNQVNEYLDKHNLIWQNMTQIDLNIMWMNIL